MSRAVADLQAWGVCALCRVAIWAEQSVHEQRCTCLCGAVAIYCGDKTGTDWDDISEVDFQTIIDKEYGL